MAVDTRDERGAAVGFQHAWQPVYPLADGDAGDEPDRQQVVAAWNGISSAPPTPDLFTPVEYITAAVIRR